jgi:hypothetical protein
MAVRFIRRAADQGRFGLEGEVERFEDTECLGDDFGADAVTGEYCDFHEGLFGS